MALPRHTVIELARLHGPLLDDGAGRVRLTQAIQDSHPDLAVSRTDLDRIQGAWDALSTEGATVEFDESDEAYVVSGPVCMNLADLREAFGIDPEMYDEFPVSITPNNWNVTSSSGRVLSNWQVKARYERRPLLRHLEPSFELPKIPRTPAPNPSEEYLTVLIPDAQIGFRWRDRWTYAEPIHDRVALDVILQFCQRNAHRVTRIVWGGDNLDLAELSLKFSKTMDKALRDTTDISVLEFRYWLRRFREACPHAEMDVLPGNHDKRWTDYVTANASALSSIVTLEDVLRLDEVDATYHGPYGASVRVSPHSYATHGDFHGRTAAEKHLAQMSENNIWFFHNHRELVAERRTREGKALWARCPGFVARTDPGVVPAGKHHTDYFQGFGIEEGDSVTSFPTVLRIVDGQVMVGGERIVGRDHAAEVAEWAGVPQLKPSE